MKLSKVTFAYIVTLALIVMVFEFFASNFIVTSGFDKLERAAVASDARRVKNEFLREIETLDTFLWDWSSWDDTYVFAQNGNEEYIESNLQLETFLDQSLNAVVVTGSGGRVIYGRAVDSEGKESDELLAGVVEYMEMSRMPSIVEDGGGGGVVFLPEGPIMIVMRPVLKSDGSGPPSGAIAMARLLGAEIVEYISKRLELDITVHALKNDTLTPDTYADVLGSLEAGQEAVVVPKTQDVIQGFAMLRDVRGFPCLMLEVNEPRNISSHGRIVALYNHALLAVVLVAFSVLVFYLLHHRILSRVERLNQQVKNVDLSGKSVVSVTVEGDDEVAELADNVNGMLYMLAQDQEALQRTHDELEAKVTERTLELEEANEELLCLDKAKSHFLSSTSHELRTPLTAIHGFIKLMERTFKKRFQPHLEGVEDARSSVEKYLDNFKIVGHETERLGRLIDDILDLNKIEAGRMEWRDTDVNVSDLIQGAVNTIAGQFEETPEVDLLVDVPAGIPTIHVDKDRVHQVLINLLNNAAKFTSQGHVKVMAAVDGNEVEFTIEDTGGGIPESDIQQIFEFFYQSQAGEKVADKPFGTGLGLAICKEIVEHYGGRIWVESEEGTGASFKFVLPLK